MTIMYMLGIIVDKFGILFLIVVTLACPILSQESVQPIRNQSDPFALEQQLSDLNREISADLTNKEKTTVAVLDFADLQGNVSDFGRFLAEELITRLFKTKKIRVVDRREVEKIVAEHKSTMTNVKGAIRTNNLIGVLTEELIKTIGKRLGVRAIVYGTITEIGESYRINARIISTDAGTVFATAAATIRKGPDINSLILSGKTPIEVPAKSNAATNTNLNAPLPPPTSQSSNFRQETDFFSFDLQRCRLSGTSVLCELTVTNNDIDRRISVYAGLFDNFGNESKYGSVEIANSGRTAVLVSGIQTKLRISFSRKISSDASHISLLTLKVNIEGRTTNEIEFRGIPLR